MPGNVSSDRRLFRTFSLSELAGDSSPLLYCSDCFAMFAVSRIADDFYGYYVAFVSVSASFHYSLTFHL